MFDVGFSELVLLFIIGLLVLGPQRLPKVAAEIGKWVGRARRTATQLRRQLEREIELSDIASPPPPSSSSTPQQPSPPPVTEPAAPPEQNPFVAEAAAPPEAPPEAAPEAAHAQPQPETTDKPHA